MTSLARVEFCVSFTAAMPALRPNCLPIEWEAVGLTCGIESSERAADVPGLRMRGAEPPHSCMC